MTVQDLLARVSKTLMLKEPFYGYFLITLNKVFKKGLGTAGVSKHNINYQLAIDPEFWEKELNENQRIGVLKHELLHIAFGHLIMRDKYPTNQWELFNIAADCEINQYIDKAYLPEKCIDIDELKKQPGLGHLEYKKGTHYYMEELIKYQKNNPSPQAQVYFDENGDPHTTWEEFSNLTEAERKMIQKQVEGQLKRAADQVSKGRGTIPGEFADIIDRLFKPTDPPKFDWKGYLRRFAGGSQKIYTKKLRRKPNKRYEANPGLKIKPKKHILVGVDTSGSVSTSELQEFFHEIYHINKTGADVTVIQCDTEIVDISPYKKGDEMKIHGRGGTDFTPVVDYYNKNNRNYSCLVYLTDGEAPNPDNPPRGRTLWVISAQSGMNEKLPGQVIQLN